MTKKQLIAALATSTLLLSSTGVALADEVTPVDPTAPSTEVVTPSAGTEASTDVTTPSTETPATTPSDSGSTTIPTVPVDPTTPSTDQGKDNAGENVPVPGSDTGGKDTSGENVDPQPTPDNQDKDNAGTPVPTGDNTASSSQGDTSSPVIGQVVQNVTPQAPVVTNTGATIVSTKDGQLILSDGSTVTPETVGATTNSDKTITVTKADGTKATLPKTGEGKNLLGLLGSVLLGAAAWLFRKKQA